MTARPHRSRTLVLALIGAAIAFAAGFVAARSSAGDDAKAPEPQRVPVTGPVSSGTAEPRGTPGRTMSAADIQYYNRAVADPAEAQVALTKVRASLDQGLDPPFHGFARQVELRCLMVTDAPAAQVVAAADTAVRYLPGDPGQRAVFHLGIAQYLTHRGEMLDRAAEYARVGVALAPEKARDLRAYAEATLGAVHLKLGNADSAIVLLSRAVPATPDSQMALYYLGTAYEKAGKPKAALDAYVRSMAAFPSKDTSAAAPLRALWIKQNGSLKGMDERIHATRSATVRAFAESSRSDARPAPGWELYDVQGEPVRLADFKGRVVVLDFWGSWCGPCRMELPYFQKLHEKYRDHPDVKVMSVNWEQMRSNVEKKARATEFMEKEGFTFPVVFDHDQAVAKAYGVTGYPTVFMIDPEGRIQYTNSGFIPGIDAIMEEQIAAMMKKK